jgi:bifunctional non-homologous end joining protein LigD
MMKEEALTGPPKLLPLRHEATFTKRQKTNTAIMPQRQQKVLAQSSSTIATGFPRIIKPMLAMPVDEPFNDDQWVFEFKWDGVRSILLLNKAKNILEIQSRNGKPITHSRPEIVDQIKKSLIDGNSIKYRESVILDGEIVVLNQRGLPDFQKHQRRMNIKSTAEIRALSCKMPATYYVLDILYLDGRNLQGLPLLQRRKILSDVLANTVESEYQNM